MKRVPCNVCYQLHHEQSHYPIISYKAVFPCIKDMHCSPLETKRFSLYLNCLHCLNAPLLRAPLCSANKCGIVMLNTERIIGLWLNLMLTTTEQTRWREKEVPNWDCTYMHICSNCCYTYLDLARVPYLEKIIMNVVLALKMHKMFVYYYETTRATLSHDNSHLW